MVNFTYLAVSVGVVLATLVVYALLSLGRPRDSDRERRE